MDPSTFTLEDRIVAALRRILREVDLHSRRLVEDHGLTGPQLAVLRELSRSGTSTAGQLARRVHLSAATLTGIATRLERRGLIERRRSERDRRAVELSLTVEGLRALASTPSLLQDRFRAELARLEDWEQSSLLAALQRIASMMGTEVADTAPHLESAPRLDAPPPPVAESEPLGDSEPPQRAAN